jgi:hypothetical protein
MGRKSLGTALEINMVKKAFKNGGWGFRAPGSGSFTPHQDVFEREGLQAECTIKLSVAHVDLGYKTTYLTADYVAFIPEWEEVRVVEAKTVRLKTKKKEKGKKARTEKMISYYYLTDVVKKEKIGRGDKKRENPLFGMMKKSDFCMELERAWMLARLMDEGGAFNVPVRSYLHVRFMKAGAEAFFSVPDLVGNKAKKPDQDVLKVIKEEDGSIRFEWQGRKKEA